MKRAPSIADFVQGSFRLEGNTYNAVGETWLEGTYSDKSVEIFPGIFQHTPKYHSFKRRLWQRLKEIPTVFSAREGWFFSSPNQCLCDWGSLSSPLLCPMEDNTQLRKDFSLRDPSREEEKLIYRFFEDVLQNGSHSSVHIRKVSTMGFPWMQRGVRLKLDIIRSVMRDPAEFLARTADRDWYWLLRFHSSYPVYTNGIRIQADKVKLDEDGRPFTKQRFTYREEAVMRGVFTDKDKIPIDKTCHDSLGNVVDDIVSARVRSMYALSYHFNCVLQMVNNFCYNGLISVVKGVHYEGETTLSDNIKQFLKFEEGDIFTLDKSNFGETFHPRVLEIFLEVFGRKLPILAEFIRVCIDAPTFLRSYRKGVKGVITTRPQLDKDRNLSLRGSFKSGNGLVSFLGKALGAIDAMLILRRALGSTFSYERFCANSDPRFRYYGSGDDTLFIAPKNGVGSAIRESVESGASLHKDEVEVGPRYLGNYYSNYGDVQCDMAVFIETMTGIERSINLKTFPKLGIFAKYYKYKPNPLFRDISSIIEEEYLNFYDFSIQKYIANQSLVGNNNALFLADPEKLMYLPGLEVDANLVAQEYETVSAEAIADYWAHFI